MPWNTRVIVLAVMVGMVGLISCTTIQAEPDDTSPPGSPSQPEAPPSGDSINRLQEEDDQAGADAVLPHLQVDRASRTVDIESRVVLREGEWLELLACSPGTRTHESVLEALALPSHIHLALITIGLEPGSPMRWRLEEGKSVMTPPIGPDVLVSIVTEQDGVRTERPANEWVKDRTTGLAMEGNMWMFTGSGFTKETQKYIADLTGSVLSLVNFGDETLARHTTLTNQTDGAIWIPRTEVIPPVGTIVWIRLRPAPETRNNNPSP